jgi:hypothetical protein
MAGTLEEERQNLGATIDTYIDLGSYMIGLAAHRDVCVDREPELADKLSDVYIAWEGRNKPTVKELDKLFWNKVAHLIMIDPADKAGARGLTKDAIWTRIVQHGNDVRAHLRKESESSISYICMDFYKSLRSKELDLARRKEAEINTFRIVSEVPQ